MRHLANKIPPPIVMVIFMVVMWGVSQFGASIELNPFIRNLCIALLFAVGSIFGAGGAISFKKAETTVNPLKPETASTLVTTGVYRITRNPMYVGLALFLIAWGIFLSSIWAFLCIPIFVFYINQFQIVPEERALKKVFGDEFERYCSDVRRWL